MPFSNLGAFDVMDILQNIVSYAIMAAIIILVLRILFTRLFTRTVTVKAKVIDKEADTYNAVSQYPTHNTTTNYVVAFYTGARTLRFCTSVFVFDSVNIGDVGVLKFKGDRIISFE